MTNQCFHLQAEFSPIVVQVPKRISPFKHLLASFLHTPSWHWARLFGETSVQRVNQWRAVGKQGWDLTDAILRRHPERTAGERLLVTRPTRCVRSHCQLFAPNLGLRKTASGETRRGGDVVA